VGAFWFIQTENPSGVLARRAMGSVALELLILTRVLAPGKSIIRRPLIRSGGTAQQRVVYVAQMVLVICSPTRFTPQTIFFFKISGAQKRKFRICQIHRSHPPSARRVSLGGSGAVIAGLAAAVQCYVLGQFPMNAAQQR